MKLQLAIAELMQLFDEAQRSTCSAVKPGAPTLESTLSERSCTISSSVWGLSSRMREIPSIHWPVGDRAMVGKGGVVFHAFDASRTPEIVLSVCLIVYTSSLADPQFRSLKKPSFPFLIFRISGRALASARPETGVPRSNLLNRNPFYTEDCTDRLDPSIQSEDERARAHGPKKRRPLPESSHKAVRSATKDYNRSRARTTRL